VKITTKITVTLKNGKERIFMRDRNYEDSSPTDIQSMIEDNKMIQDLDPRKVQYQCVAIEGIPVSEIAAALRKNQ
jgi:hypothetical protein